MSTAAPEPLPDVVAPSALESIQRAEVDLQIATAHRYPRQLSLVRQRMQSMACLDAETAAACFYTLPARKGSEDGPIQGPGVRLAEIAISCYGHIRAAARVISDDGKFITAQGMVHDLENNVSVAIETKRRITTKKGERYSDDMIATTGNAACSIALRNAVFRVVPLALIKPVYEAAKKLAVGDGKSLVQRRGAALQWFHKLGVSTEEVCRVLEVRAPEDIQLDKLEALLGYATAIKDGDATVDEIFRPKPAPAGAAGIKIGRPDQPKPEKEPEPTVPATNPREFILNKLQEHEVELGDFLDWLRITGRDRAARLFDEVGDPVFAGLVSEPTAFEKCLITYGKKRPEK